MMAYVAFWLGVAVGTVTGIALTLDVLYRAGAFRRKERVVYAIVSVDAYGLDIAARPIESLSEPSRN